MNVGCLFAGIDGMGAGLERAGHKILWQVELLEKRRRILARHFPHTKRFDDVRSVGADCLEPVELLCGGFPCQDLSVAGLRKGLAGPRSGLWAEMHRIIAELAPPWVLIENVTGLLSSWSPVEAPPRTLEDRVFDSRDEAEAWAESLQGEWDVEETSDLGTVLTDLAQLGYGWAYRTLDAQYFGVAQRRHRVFVVGSLGGAARAGEVLFDPESGEGNPPPGRQTRTSSAPTTENGSGKPRLMRWREGRPGGGKGALIADDASLTLATSNDQILFETVSTLQGGASRPSHRRGGRSGRSSHR